MAFELTETRRFASWREWRGMVNDLMWAQRIRGSFCPAGRQRVPSDERFAGQDFRGTTFADQLFAGPKVPEPEPLWDTELPF